MADINNIDFDMEIYFKFYVVDNELEYIEKSLEFLHKSLSYKFKELEEEFNNALHSLYLDDYNSGFLNNHPNPYLPTELLLENLSDEREEEYQTHDTIHGYILQSILVKQVSIIEKFFKSLHQYTNDKNNLIIDEQFSIIKEIQRNGIKRSICNFLCNNKKKKQFSDITKTVTAITKNTKINIKNIDKNNWCQLRIMNELRNRFAHGSNEFIITKEILKDFKSEFEDKFINVIQQKDNNYLCKLEKDFESLIKFNKNMRNYMKQIEKEFVKYYKDISNTKHNNY